MVNIRALRNMSLFGLICLFFLTGCDDTRALTPSERESVFLIKHDLNQKAAYDKSEVWVSSDFSGGARGNIDVRQPENGLMIAKSMFQWQVTYYLSVIVPQEISITVRIENADKATRLIFMIQPRCSASAISRIKKTCASYANDCAGELRGTVTWSCNGPPPEVAPNKTTENTVITQ